MSLSPSSTTNANSMAIVYHYEFPNGRGYVGQTIKTVGQRLREHVQDARRGARTPLNNAILKYGVEGIKVIVLCRRVSATTAKLLEVEAISILKTVHPDGYNLTGGGDGISDPSGEIGRKRGRTMTGRKHPPEVLAKIAVGNRSPERRVAITIGLQRSEVREKLAVLNGSPERRARIAAALKTPEARAKMSVSQKARWARTRNQNPI
jgi:hypothetical protein